MTPHNMIERYVAQVAFRLPTNMRADVAAELRDLLIDGLNQRAGGREPDLQLAADFLSSFGSPAEVALRYHAAPAIIEPADARLFAKLAFGLLIALGVLAVSLVLASPQSDWLTAAMSGAYRYTRLSLLILGVLVAAFWLWGAARRMYPGLSVWKPHSLPPVRDPDQINRIGNVAALTAWTLGFLILMQPVVFFDVLWGGQAPAAVRHVFAYDEAFGRERAAILWLVLGASLLVYAWATIEGRWRKLTRRIELGLAVSICAVSAWIVLAGDIFEGEATNQTMKFAMALLAGFTLIDVRRQIDNDRLSGASASSRFG